MCVDIGVAECVCLFVGVWVQEVGTSLNPNHVFMNRYSEAEP